MTEYARTKSLRSWHILRTWTRVPDVGEALCGKRVVGRTQDTFGDDKSCESCLRIQARRGT